MVVFALCKLSTSKDFKVISPCLFKVACNSIACTLLKLSRLMGKPTTWFPNRSDTNQAAQSQKQARSLKFWNIVEEESYYPSSENKGADQLRGYREADLHLCFRLCRFTAKLICIFVFAYADCWFSHEAAQI